MKAWVLRMLLFIWVMAPPVQGRGAIPVRVDPRIELMTAIQLVAGYDVLTPYECAYRREVLTYFSPYQNHRAIRLFRTMSRKRFSYDAVPAAFLALGDPPALQLHAWPDMNSTARAGGRDTLQMFYEAVRDFARVSRFMAFFEAHRAFYDRLVREAPGGLDTAVNALEAYTGVTLKSPIVVLAPLLHDGGYGATVYPGDGTTEIYALIGPSTVRNDMPDWGTPSDFATNVVHELAHSVVNPLTNRYANRLSSLNRLYRPIADRLYVAAYNNWHVVFDEHVVRALTVRILSEIAGQEDAVSIERSDRRMGFVYMPVILQTLQTYERQRSRYRDLETFYLRFFDALEGLTKREAKDLQMDWSINGISRDKSAVVFIVPTGERLPVLNQTIRQYATLIRDQIFPGASIMTDAEALTTDLSERTPIVYGTMTGNHWLARRVHDFSFRIYPDSIVADTTFIGTDLRLITTWRNPDNPDRVMLIYTAQRAEEINGAHGVLHGETEYVVARNRQVIRAADYPYRRAGRPQ